MLTRATADRSDRDSDTGVGGWRGDEEGGEEESRQTDRDVRHMLGPADDTLVTWRSKGR